uniref:DUF4781 domain-containing protein n=1 Tax=Panagrolaimus sp. JU765 TaxID=591449 RepID=A0AC34QNE2_9BILA
MNLFYQNYGKQEWHEYSKTSASDQELMIGVISHAMFGNADNVVSNKDDQKFKESLRIKEKIFEASDSNSENCVKFSIIFIIGHLDGKTVPIPVFRVYSGTATGFLVRSSYVDTNGRIYFDWDDWKKTNTLPKMEYCLPKNGFYQIHPKRNYDYDKLPKCEFSESPASNPFTDVINVVDSVSGMISLITGGILIVSSVLPTPLPSIISSIVAAIGGMTAAYGVGRYIHLSELF